jgi:2-polyprenyl-6-methoxyphenol hydroxylase-like FAD-dependent oxidoreductase
MAQSFQTVVVGAGICGLSTALAAHQSGSNVTVLESAPAIAPLGTAISLWPNALGCFASWGLDTAINQIGIRFDKVATRHPDGSPILEYDLAELHARHHHHSRCVTRADLQTLLASHLPADALRLNSTATSVDWTDDNATIHLADGTSITADLVVVADGQNSTLRSQVVGETPLHPAGYGAVLGLADIDIAPPGWDDANEACEYYGPNGRFGVFRSGPDQIYWFFVSNDIAPASHATPGDKDWLLTQLRDWPDFTRTLVENTAPDRMPQVSFNDRAPVKHWGNGRVLLAGDAAHPMIPNFGQGANQAIEDAFALGLGLKLGKSGADLADFYAKTRKRKAEGLVKQSRQNGQLTQQTNRLGKAIRNTMMRNMPTWAITAQLDKHFDLANLHSMDADL